MNEFIRRVNLMNELWGEKPVYYDQDGNAYYPDFETDCDTTTPLAGSLNAERIKTGLPPIAHKSKFEQDEDASNMLKNTLVSLEHRIREAYNKGYRAGMKAAKEDPVELHDVISTGFSNIEKVIREETAKMSEYLHAMVHKED